MAADANGSNICHERIRKAGCHIKCYSSGKNKKGPAVQRNCNLRGEEFWGDWTTSYSSGDSRYQCAAQSSEERDSTLQQRQRRHLPCGDLALSDTMPPFRDHHHVHAYDCHSHLYSRSGLPHNITNVCYWTCMLFNVSWTNLCPQVWELWQVMKNSCRLCSKWITAATLMSCVGTLMTHITDARCMGLNIGMYAKLIFWAKSGSGSWATVACQLNG